MDAPRDGAKPTSERGSSSRDGIDSSGRATSPAADGGSSHPVGGDSAPTADEISHPLFAALYDLLPDDVLLSPHREYLAADLSGRVLDLGAGTGAMIPHVANAAETDTVANGGDGSTLEYHAVEPDPHMRRRAERRARTVELPVDLRDARAESLPYPDDAFDVVLAGMVFCTIEDPESALDEVARVLNPGGEFRFLEHVHADGWRATGQDLLTPLWERAAGGCQLNRETIDLFVGHDAFSVEELERVDFGIFPATPFVRGRLRRTRATPFSR